MHDTSSNMAMSQIHTNNRNQQHEGNSQDKIDLLIEALKNSHEQVLDAVASVTGGVPSPHKPRNVKTIDFQALTKREVQVVALMSEGLSKQKIAEQMDISRSTVCTHARHIFKKLRVSNAS
ncbi:MAG: response regulator transcription factor, partial [Akkermansiaceae bacterium]